MTFLGGAAAAFASAAQFNWTAVAVPLVVALIAASGTYLVARRTRSGDIGTSDASDLWAESQAIRKELREEVISLREQLSIQGQRCQERITALERTVRELRQRLGEDA